MNETVQEVAETSEKMGIGKRLMNIYLSPVEFFNNLKDHPTWLVPYILTILVAIFFALSTKDIMLNFQKEAIYNSSRIPEEFKDKAVERMENKTETRRYIETIGGTTVSLTVILLVAAGAFWIMGNFILGGKASYKQMVSMYSWVGMISLLESLIKLPLVLAKNSIHVYTSLAIFMDPSKFKTPLFMLLNAFDIFTIWRIALWTIGFSIIYKFTRGKALTGVLVLYALYLAGAIALANIF